MHARLRLRVVCRLGFAGLGLTLVTACGSDAAPTTDDANEPTAASASPPQEAPQPTNDGGDVAFVPRGETITEGIQAHIEKRDPARDGWRSEALHDLAKPLIHDFVHALTEKRPGLSLPWPAFRERFLSTGFEGLSVLRPPLLELAFEDGTSSVWRAEDIPAERLTADELPRLARELLAPFRGHLNIHAKSKLFSMDMDPENPARFSSRVLVRLDGRSPSHELVQTNMEWRVGFEALANDTAVRIRSIRVTAFDEVRAEAAYFGDLTERILGRIPRFEEEFLLGAGQYHFRNDRLNGNVYSGSQGLAVGDANGDGLDDIFVAQHGGIPNRLLVRTPQGGVLDSSAESGVDLLEKTQSALFLDLDNDGDQDLAMSCRSAIVLGYNDGEGHFELRNPLGSSSDEITSLSAADYDGDGDLDLYACMYAQAGPLGTIPSPYHDATNGPPNQLWRNDGKRQFTDVTSDVGLDENNVKFSYASLWDDFDQDGDPDLYVANDFGKNHLYRNEGGRFRDVATELGAADMAAGMGVTAADFDLDGDTDLYVTNMFSSAGRRIVAQTDRFMDGAKQDVHEHYLRHARGNTLLRNEGDGSFADITDESGATIAGWAWGAKALDFNNDGLADLYSPNGFISGTKKDDL